MNDWALAADGYGIVSMLELRRAGLTSAEIEALVRRGLLTRLARGWYAVHTPVSAEHRHVLTTRAMLRAHEGRAVAGHHSALLLLGLPTYGADLETVRLNRREVGSPRTRTGQRLGRAVPLEGQFEATVVPALAVVQHGISAGSLSALVAADAFVRGGGSVEDLDGALAWVRYHPHTTQLRSALDRVDGRHESPGETLLGHALHVMGVASTPQVPSPMGRSEQWSTSSSTRASSSSSTVGSSMGAPQIPPTRSVGGSLPSKSSGRRKHERTTSANSAMRWSG